MVPPTVFVVPNPMDPCTVGGGRGFSGKVPIFLNSTIMRFTLKSKMTFVFLKTPSGGEGEQCIDSKAQGNNGLVRKMDSIQ